MTPPALVLDCACGDTREFSQMYLHCTGGGDHVMHFEIKCVDCMVSDGDDIDRDITLGQLAELLSVVRREVQADHEHWRANPGRSVVDAYEDRRESFATLRKLLYTFPENTP